MRISLPLKTVSEMNCRGWRKRAERTKLQRSIVRAYMHGIIRKPMMFPLSITLRRFSPGWKPLDDDNLRCSMKAVRDGVADALKIDDGDKTKASWEYDQARDSMYRIEIDIHPK